MILVGQEPMYLYLLVTSELDCAQGFPGSSMRASRACGTVTVEVAFSLSKIDLLARRLLDLAP